MIWETSNPGHDNLTVGYEKYTHVVTLGLEKIKKIGQSTGKKLFGFPIEYEDTETSLVQFNKETDRIDKIRYYLPEKRKSDKDPMFTIPFEIDYN